MPLRSALSMLALTLAMAPPSDGSAAVTLLPAQIVAQADAPPGIRSSLRDLGRIDPADIAGVDSKQGTEVAQTLSLFGREDLIAARSSNYRANGCAPLAGAGDAPDRLFIDSSCIKVHRCAGGGKGGPWLMVSAARKVDATPSSTRSATRKGALASCS